MKLWAIILILKVNRFLGKGSKVFNSVVTAGSKVARNRTLVHLGRELTKTSSLVLCWGPWAFHSDLLVVCGCMRECG